MLESTTSDLFWEESVSPNLVTFPAAPGPHEFTNQVSTNHWQISIAQLKGHLEPDYDWRR